MDRLLLRQVVGDGVPGPIIGSLTRTAAGVVETGAAAGLMARLLSSAQRAGLGEADVWASLEAEGWSNGYTMLTAQ